jgi:hypothetical protein
VRKGRGGPSLGIGSMAAPGTGSTSPYTLRAMARFASRPLGISLLRVPSRASHGMAAALQNPATIPVFLAISGAPTSLAIFVRGRPIPSAFTTSESKIAMVPGSLRYAWRSRVSRFMARRKSTPVLWE